MAQYQPTGIEVFYIKYRKTIMVSCALSLLCIPVVVYQAPSFSSGNTGEAAGYWINAILLLIAPLYLFINTRRAYKAYIKEVAEIDEANKE